MSTSHNTFYTDNEDLAREFQEISFIDYKIIQLIGKGAFSSVYLAYTPEYKRRAIKRLRLTSKPYQILREIEFLRRLEGKSNVVQIKGVHFSSHTLQTTVITNFSDSVDFDTLVRTATPREIQAYTRSLLEALAHVERAHILHRDIKPGNFLFSRRTGEALLIDFGLAQTLREAHEFPIIRQRLRKRSVVRRQTGRVPSLAGYVNREQVRLNPLAPQPHSGTHGYRAPEVLSSVATQDERIDTWSAGVILLQLLLGKKGLFRCENGNDFYELTAIRALIGVDRFTQGMGRVGADFSLTAGVPIPACVSIEELCVEFNPDLFAVLPPAAFDLCRWLLAFDHHTRPRASEALRHPFLTMSSEHVANRRVPVAVRTEPLLDTANFNVFHAKLLAMAQEICRRARIPADTAANLDSEYRHIKSAMLIQPLPKDIRTLVDRCLERFHLAKPQVSDVGPTVGRFLESDYSMPSLHGVRDLQKTFGAHLMYPSIVAAPGFAVGASAEDHAIQEEIERAKEQCGEPISTARARRRVLQRCNREKELWETAIRMTAVRRRLDPWVQPLKALDFELQTVQREVRQAAEDYRFALIEQGHIPIKNSMSRALAAKGIFHMQERLGAPVHPPVASLRAHIESVRYERRLTMTQKDSFCPTTIYEESTPTEEKLGNALQAKPRSALQAFCFDEAPGAQQDARGANSRFPRRFMPSDYSVMRVLQNVLRAQLARPESKRAAQETISVAWEEAKILAVERTYKQRQRAIATVRARNRLLSMMCTQRISLRGLEGNWRPRTDVDLQERSRARAKTASADAENSKFSASPLSEIWEESITADENSNPSLAAAAPDIYHMDPTERIQPSNVQTHNASLRRRKKRRVRVRRAEAMVHDMDERYLRIFSEADADPSAPGSRGGSFVPSPIQTFRPESAPRSQASPRSIHQQYVVQKRLTAKLVPTSNIHRTLERTFSMELCRVRLAQGGLLSGGLLAPPRRGRRPRAPRRERARAPDPLQHIAHALRLTRERILTNEKSKADFIWLLSNPSTRYFVPFKQLLFGSPEALTPPPLPRALHLAIKSTISRTQKKRLHNGFYTYIKLTEGYFLSAHGKHDIARALVLAQGELDKRTLASRTNDEFLKIATMPRSPDLNRLLSLPKGFLKLGPEPVGGRSTSRSRPSRVLYDNERIQQRYPKMGQLVDEFIDQTLLNAFRAPVFVQRVEDDFARSAQAVQNRRLFLLLRDRWLRAKLELKILSKMSASTSPRQHALSHFMHTRKNTLRAMKLALELFHEFGGETLMSILVTVANPGFARTRIEADMVQCHRSQEEAIVARVVASQRALSMNPPLRKTRKKRMLLIATNADIAATLASSRVRRKITHKCALRVVNSAHLREKILYQSLHAPGRHVHTFQPRFVLSPH